MELLGAQHVVPGQARGKAQRKRRFLLAANSPQYAGFTERRRIVCRAYWALMILVAFFAPGCAHIQRQEQADRVEKIDVDELIHEQLQTESMVTVAEACRVMLVLADGTDTYTSHADRTAALEQRGIIRPEWGLEREDCIDKGTVAYMVCKILKRRGGVNREVFGNLGLGDRRYALREMIYMNLMDSSVPYRYITGAELVDLVGKVDRYMAAHKMYEEKPVDMQQLVDSAGEPTPGRGARTTQTAP